MSEETFSLDVTRISIDSPSEEITLNDLPDDLLKLIIAPCIAPSCSIDHSFEKLIRLMGTRPGDLNALRLTSKRLMQMVDAVATQLTFEPQPNGPNSSSVSIPKLAQYNRIKCIYCFSHNFNCKSLEGISNATLIKTIRITGSPFSGSDLSFFSSLNLLENISISGELKLHKLHYVRHTALSNILDLTPLASLVNLKIVNMSEQPVIDLTPLSGLKLLSNVSCYFIPFETSLLPLQFCQSLGFLGCSAGSTGWEKLQMIMPNLYIDAYNDRKFEGG